MGCFLKGVLLSLVFFCIVPGLAWSSGDMSSEWGVTILQGQTAQELSPAQETVAPLPVDQAFVLSSTVSPGLVVLHFDIAPGYALYKDRFVFSVPKTADAFVSTSHAYFPDSILREDPVFGKQAEFEHSLNVSILVTGPATHDAELSVSYQGCSAQLCYPIQTKKIQLLPNPRYLSEEKKSENLFGHWTWKVVSSLGGLFLLGVLLAFTPCILPLMPILSGIILGQKKKTVFNGLMMAMSYVLGMACAYAGLGYLITRMGANFQSVFEKPWVILLVALILILMACSMFGLYTLQLPLKIRHWVNLIDQKLKGGSALSVFLMGAVSILVISPCASAPLIAVLSLMIQTGDSLRGAVSLFVLALGMGVPLVLISVGLGKLVPKTGHWMQTVRRFIGLLMLLVAMILLFRLIPMPWREHPEIKVTSLPQLELVLKNTKTPIVLDFFATWCLECHGLARTLDSPKLAPLLDHMTVIQIDVSEADPEASKILESYHVLGLPTLVLLDKQDHEVSRLVGNLSLLQVQKGLQKIKEAP